MGVTEDGPEAVFLDFYEKYFIMLLYSIPDKNITMKVKLKVKMHSLEKLSIHIHVCIDLRIPFNNNFLNYFPLVQLFDKNMIFTFKLHYSH